LWYCSKTQAYFNFFWPIVGPIFDLVVPLKCQSLSFLFLALWYYSKTQACFNFFWPIIGPIFGLVV